MITATMIWVLVFKTTCGQLSFLNDAPSCWRDTVYEFATLDQCEEMVKNPPGLSSDQFRCELRPLHS